MPKPLLYLIHDFGVGDGAQARVALALAPHLPESVQIWDLSVQPFSTTEAGFQLAELALSPDSDPERTMFVVNVAPRRDDTEARSNNHGEPFVRVVLNNGLRILACNSGNTLSFVRHKIDRLTELNLPTGSQFRTRDALARHGGKLLIEDDRALLGRELPVSVIPEAPDDQVGEVDGFGNIKLTRRTNHMAISTLTPGSKVRFNIGSAHPREAIAAVGMFSIRETGEQLCLHPGSSGGNDPFMELSVRGGNAASMFHGIKTGQRFTMEPVA